jgi:hypothetical protein
VIFAKPSTSFESTATGFVTGLTGTIGVRVTDGVGGTTIARTTSGIVETPGGSGIYVATLTAPANVGQYQVTWDDGGSPATWAAEELTITSTGTQTVTPSTGVGLTFAQLLTEFYARGFDYLDDGGAGETRAKRWINQSYMEILEMDDWPFLQTSISSQAPVIISDLGTIESVTNTTADRNVGFIDRRTLVESYPDLSATGSPDYAYLTQGTTLNTYPVGSDTLLVRYLRLAGELSDDDDQPEIPSRYQYAIIDYACARAYMDSDNPEMAQIVRREGDALVQMMRERLLVQQHQDTDLIVTYGYSTDYR